MDFEKMSFRTPNYGDSMMGSLLNLQMSGILCDAVLKGRNVEAKVHRVILMALDCPYFKEQLVTADLNTTMESPSIVEIDTESQVDLDCFIKELYTGCLELTTSNVRNMSNIYETLKLNNQLQFCHDFEKRLLHPPGADAISNDSSQITGLDTLDVSKVSAVVCSGSDIIKVIKVETSDDEEIHDPEASKNDSETPGQIFMKSEDVKDEEPVSDVQKTEVKETSTLEKEECEKTDQPKSSANPEENLTSVANHSEVESFDDSTVKSENEDDDDGMDGFEVLDEYIEDDQEDKEQTDDPPPAKKPKQVEDCEMVVVDASSDSGDEKKKSRSTSQQQAWRNAAAHVAKLLKSGRKLSKREKNAEKLRFFRKEMAYLRGNSTPENHSQKNWRKGKTHGKSPEKLESKARPEENGEGKTKTSESSESSTKQDDSKGNHSRSEGKEGDSKKAESKEHQSTRDSSQTKNKTQEGREANGKERDKIKNRRRSGRKAASDYFCNHCKFKTSNTSVWKNHCSMVCPLIRCDHCPASFLHRDRYRSHVDRFHPKSILADQPRRLERLKFALNETGRNKDHVCSYCGETFILRELFEYHLIEHKRKEAEQKPSYQQGPIALQETVSFQRQTTHLDTFGNRLQNQREVNYGFKTGTSLPNQGLDNINRQLQLSLNQSQRPPMITAGPSLSQTGLGMMQPSFHTNPQRVSSETSNYPQPQISPSTFKNRGPVGQQEGQSNPISASQSGFLNRNQVTPGGNNLQPSQAFAWSQGIGGNYGGSSFESKSSFSSSPQRYGLSFPTQTGMNRHMTKAPDVPRSISQGASTDRSMSQTMGASRSLQQGKMASNPFVHDYDAGGGKNQSSAMETNTQNKSRMPRKRNRKKMAATANFYVTQQPIHCPSCDYQTNEIASYNKHQRSSCKNSIMCKHCHGYFNNSNELQAHQDSVHLIRCQGCRAVFYDQVHLDNHVQKSHLPKNKNAARPDM